MRVGVRINFGKMVISANVAGEICHFRAGYVETLRRVYAKFIYVRKYSTFEGVCPEEIEKNWDEIDAFV